MAWDFSTPPEFQEKLDWIEKFCKEEIEPLDLVFPGAVRSRNPKVKALVDPLKQQVKDQGLWALFLDEDLGGPGFGQLKLALVNEILGRYGSAPAIFGTAAPDTGNMEILAAYGTDEQRSAGSTPS
jgi:acyl-CoA dehydrogenase